MWLNKAARFLERATVLGTRLTNTVGMVILAVLMFFTAADVILRYAFNRPILGSVELTEFMMAIVVSFALAYTAVRKGHVSVDMLVLRFSPRVRAVISSTTSLLTLGIFFLITWRSIVYGENLRAGNYVSGIWNIPTYPFLYVIALGAAIICLLLLANLLNYLAQALKGVRWWAGAGLMMIVVLVIALFAAPVWGEGIIWELSPLEAGVAGIILLIIVLFSGMSIGVVMALVGFMGMAYVNSVGASLIMMGNSPQNTMSAYSLSVVPLFILMGSLCLYSGLSQELYYTVYRWIGHLPGGLAMATVGACAAFAAVSGTGVATVATIGTVAIPEMKRYNYDSALATGSVAAGGTIGALIPPSVALVLYGILTEQSIGKLFLAGFIPGILEAVFYMIAIYILCKRNPLAGPRGPSTSFKDKVVSLKSTWGVVALFILVLGGLYIGIFTPTEAAGVGAFGAFIYAIGMRKLNWQTFKSSLTETGSITGMCFLILIGGVLLGYFLAVTRLPFQLADIVAGFAVNRYLILAAILVLYLLLGAIMSALAMIILITPIFFPVITALGFDPIWFGIITVRMMEIGEITPPVGVCVFVIQGVAKDVPLYTIFRGIAPFLVADICHVLFLVAVPQVTLFLPGLME